MKLKDAKYFGIKLSPHRIKNDKGQLIVTGCEFARTGKQKYHSSELGIEDKDEFIYLDRPVEEVSDPKTVASFEGAPVTLDHPEDDVKVGVNYNELAKGFAKDVKYVAINDKEGYLQADFVITDADLIKKIENNEINELSAGYNCDVDENDWVQRHIRGNHIAVVEQARAGHQARLLDNKYKSTSKSQKTLKIGDSVVKIVDSYSYELEELDGTKTRYTDYYTEGPTGKKKYVITLKDEDTKKGISKEELKSKLAKEFDANVDFNGISYLTVRYKKPVRTNATTQQKNYSRLKSILDNLGIKYDESFRVANKSNSWGMQIYLDGYFNKEGIFVADSKKVKDSKESDARVLKALENLLPEFKKLDKKYAGLVAMQKKYWNNWDGYRKAVRSGELSEAKLEKMQAQSVKANKEYLDLVKKWNKLCEQTTRREDFTHYIKGVATEIKGSEDIHFPEDHYYGSYYNDTSFEKFSHMLNEINKVLANYPKGTGDEDWRVKSNDSKVKDNEKTEWISTPRGSFKLVNKTEEELRKEGYGYHHSSDDNKYKVFTKNNKAVAIKNIKSKDSKVEDSAKIYKIDGAEYILSKDGYGNYKLDEKKTGDRVADWDSYKEAIKDINKWIKQNKITDSKKFKDSEDEIFARRQEIDDNLKEVFNEKFFDIEGFVNGNESTEGSIYVVYYNPYDDSEAVEYANDNLDEDYDDEEFLDCASEFIEDKIERILRDKYNMMGENGSIDSIDVAPIDWSGEEEYPINFHIYCNGVTE